MRVPRTPTLAQNCAVSILIATCACSASEPSASTNPNSGGAPTFGGVTASAAGASASGAGVGTSGTSGTSAVANGGTATAVAGNAAGGSASAGTAGQGPTTAGAGGSAGLGGSSSAITVQLDKTEQVMEGFGINDVFQPAFSTEFLDTLFGTADGQIGLSILRVGMGPDGNLYNGTNAANDIKGASARGVKTFIGSAWTANIECKTNGDLQDGGFMKNEACFTTWATTLAAFPAKVKAAAGVDLYAMSPANEPDFASCGLVEPCNGNYDTMLYKDTDAVKLVNAVGPLLHALTPKVKLIAPEPSEWIHLWTNESGTGSYPGGKPSSNPLHGMNYDYGHAFFKDATAWGLIDILGVHQYDTQVAEPWPSDVTTRKPIFQTEMSGVAWWPEEGPSSHIANGVVVAGWIHDAIVNGPVSAWVWWWPKPLMPSSTGNRTDDNEGLWLQNGMKTKRLYTLGNFSKFIRPGYTRLSIAGAMSPDVLLSAYKGPEGAIVVVAINKGATSVSLPISISGGAAPASLTPWVTSVDYDLKAQAPVSVSGGGFTASLPSQSVTTFVGK
jgi:glucuronoarabinoxylan endo-1,4-beta-xylanase